MRNDRDHVFIDCGPVGQGGRGGHGHNDCLSFEAVLDGVHLVTDCGAYVYTASATERNHFRSTAYHNTPQVDGAELNRFISWDQLWTLRDDAMPEVRQWEVGPERDVFVGAHSGYQRLTPAVTPVRTIVLEHDRHALRIDDAIVGPGEHVVTHPAAPRAWRGGRAPVSERACSSKPTGRHFCSSGHPKPTGKSRSGMAACRLATVSPSRLCDSCGAARRMPRRCPCVSRRPPSRFRVQSLRRRR